MKSRELLERSRQAVWHPCTQMKAHERFPLGADRARRGRVALRLRRPALSRRDQLVVGEPLRPRPPAHQRGDARAARAPRARDAGGLHPRAGGRALRAAGSRARPPATARPRFYASDGASAAEIALKMSFHYWSNAGRPEKRAFVALSGGYHGETLGALAVTDVALFRDAYAPLLRQGAIVPSPDCARRRAGRIAARSMRSAAPPRWNAISTKHHDQTAALIVEPLVQGAAGMAHVPPGVSAQGEAPVRRAMSVHLIADEIDRLRPHGHDVRLRAGPVRARLPVPVEGHHRRLPAAVVRAGDRRRSTRRSTTTTSRAGSCTRIPTPATRSPAAPRSPCFDLCERRRSSRPTGRKQSASYGQSRAASRSIRECATSATPG